MCGKDLFVLFARAHVGGLPKPHYRLYHQQPVRRFAMLRFVLIFLGSGIGGVGRYALGGWVQRYGNGAFPLGTLVVNLIGCLLIGFLTVVLSGRLLVGDDYRVGLIVGVVGGFTTFSAFGIETFTLFQQGQFTRAGAYVAASIGIGLACVWIGYRIGESAFLQS